MSIDNPDKFWAEEAKCLTWFRGFDHVRQGGFQKGNIAWYMGGKLNACYNCVDRHVYDYNRADKVAILYEGNEPSDVRRLTYRDLLDEVCKFANVLKAAGVRKGDCVCIYMPMVPEAAVAMLACARIGAPHSVVFAGFSAKALKDRIIHGECKYVICADEGKRGAKTIPLKATVDAALDECKDVVTNIVYRHTGGNITMKEGRDVWWHEEMAKARPYCPCEVMDSEDTLFMLFTSGSTGKPKGLEHTTAGYMVWTSITHRTSFDLRENDIYACVADVGWITGHSYIVYGPLANGATTFMFESTPLYPDAGRYWDMVQRHNINVFYTAPTAIRALMSYGEKYVSKYDRSSLRIMGSVGEPINPEAWKWYYEVVGESKAFIVDTYWQTETGGHVLTPLPGATTQKPGLCMTPFYGIKPVVLDASTAQPVVPDSKQSVSGVLCIGEPWPGIARTCHADHQRYLNVYMKPYPGYYFTGDGCSYDTDGHIRISGRVDDVINVSGHRLGTAEVESALVNNPDVSESAVIAIPHDIKGQCLFAFVVMNQGKTLDAKVTKSLKLCVRQAIGGFAIPDFICPAPLPKTRSGKIMRRVLRKLAEGETNVSVLGDLSTLADESVVPAIMASVAAVRA